MRRKRKPHLAYFRIQWLRPMITISLGEVVVSFASCSRASHEVHICAFDHYAIVVSVCVCVFVCV